MLARLWSPTQVVAFGVRDSELELARRVGATETVDVSGGDASFAGGLDLVVETAGAGRGRRARDPAARVRAATPSCSGLRAWGGSCAYRPNASSFATSRCSAASDIRRRSGAVWSSWLARALSISRDRGQARPGRAVRGCLPADGGRQRRRRADPAERGRVRPAGQASEHCRGAPAQPLTSWAKPRPHAIPPAVFRRVHGDVRQSHHAPEPATPIDRAIAGVGLDDLRVARELPPCQPRQKLGCAALRLPADNHVVILYAAVPCSVDPVVGGPCGRFPATVGVRRVEVGDSGADSAVCGLARLQRRSATSLPPITSRAAAAQAVPSMTAAIVRRFAPCLPLSLITEPQSR